jgi:hypothetical protein
LYKDYQNEERIEKLQAVTYTLQGDKVVTTKLDKGSLFKDKANKFQTIQKFTFPNFARRLYNRM